MIGPVQPEPPPDAGLLEELPTVVEEKPAPPVVADEPPPPEPPPADLPIDQVASIAAEIAERKRAQPAVLDAHGLEARDWTHNEARWARAIAEQASRGSHALRAAYDKAYVARVEEFRGAITPEQYARILLSIDHGRSDEELDALAIHRPALMPIVRLWTRKIAKEAGLSEAVSDALRAQQRE
jgi:hypothetical protein